MKGEQYLLIPGPTPLPERVRSAMDRPMINHRGPEFKEIFEEVLENVKKVYCSTANLVIYPSSGTGGLEAAVANFISPGDRVLVVSIGVFGDRFADIAGCFGAKVEKIEVPWGKGVEPKQVKEIIDQDSNQEIKAVLITHNETSTGVYNDVRAVKEAMGNHPALIIVDSVSGLAAVDLKMDEWNLDVVVSGSQKAFMMPPGLSFMAFNDRALEIHRRNSNVNYYWNIDYGLDYQKKGQTAFTPPVSLYFGLQEALRMMLEEGIEQILTRHKNYRDLVRDSVQEMGLQLLTEDRFASPAVTSVLAPEGIGANEIRKYMLEEFNIVLAGGQQSLDNKIFRIGHLGYIRELDLLSVLAALEITLNHLGFPVELGKGIKKAQERILREHTSG
ncbi:MAG: alanine--glyoxylate aminotransferase family protein [Bacillota bacterium]|nr:alanine--glyoxylate aminotransferase family protein [Bacillota bacterium]